MPAKSETKGSDPADSVEEVSERTEASDTSPPKVKQPMSAERLAQLAAAREKAVARRREMGDLHRREKAAKEDAFNQRLASIAHVEKEGSKHRSSKVKSKQDVVESDASVGSESDEEPTPRPVRKSRARPPSPAEPSKLRQPVYTTPQLTAEMARRELQMRVQRETYQSAFSSMFPGATLQF